MNTKYIDLTKNNNEKYIEEAVVALKRGELVIFPTETVYGLGANGLDQNAVAKIFLAKGRASDNPLILHVSNKEMLDNIVYDISEVENKLIDSFWPGPFTIILKKKKIVPDNVTCGLDTVAVRMPSEKIAHLLIEKAGFPVAAPSANISGKPSGTVALDILDEFNGKVAYILDGGGAAIGIESTVVRVIDEIPHILRPGKITPEQIKEVAGEVVIDKHVLEEMENDDTPLSPGMKHKHYAPNTKCILIFGKDNDKVVKKISELIKDNPNSLVISTKENIDKYTAKHVLSFGSKENLEEISSNIFKTLRKVDKYKADLVIIEGLQDKNEGFSLAIMNRLIRACEHNYINVD